MAMIALDEVAAMAVADDAAADDAARCMHRRWLRGRRRCCYRLETARRGARAVPRRISTLSLLTSSSPMSCFGRAVLLCCTVMWGGAPAARGEATGRAKVSTNSALAQLRPAAAKRELGDLASETPLSPRPVSIPLLGSVGWAPHGRASSISMLSDVQCSRDEGLAALRQTSDYGLRQRRVA